MDGSKRSAIPMQLPLTAIDDIIEDSLLWFYDNMQLKKAYKSHFKNKVCRNARMCLWDV